MANTISRRAAVAATLAAPIVASRSTQASAVPSPISQSFKRWNALKKELDGVLEALSASFRRFEAIAPSPPPAILFTNLRKCWQATVANCVNPEHGFVSTTGWERLARVVDVNDQEFANCARLSKEFDDASEAALISTGHRREEEECSRLSLALDALAAEIVKMQPRDLADVRLQAIIIRHRHDGEEVGPMEDQWLASILGKSDPSGMRQEETDA